MISIVYGASTVTVTYDSAAPPPSFARDIWSASWDSGTQTFAAFTKVVDG